jgi:hypothetical protein
MNYTVTIKVDTNDMDYHEDSTTLNHSQFEKFCKIVEKIKPIWRNPTNPRIEDYDETDFRSYFGQVLNEDELDWLLEMTPIPEPGYAEIEEITYIMGSPESLPSRY